MGDRPRLLDLYCGAGGAGMGFHLAGFDVVGVDVKRQPSYPFDFVQGDALEFLATADLSGFSAFHASPPCQRYTQSLNYDPARRLTHPDLLGPTRDALAAVVEGRPFVIENVVGAPIRRDVMLCGRMFGLRLFRHRLFETEGFFALQPRHAPHDLKSQPRRGEDYADDEVPTFTGNFGGGIEKAKVIMQMPWVRVRWEVAEAIPPAYTRFIGEQMLAAIGAAA